MARRYYTERASFLLKWQGLGPLGRAPASGVQSLRFGHDMGIVYQRVGETVTAVSARQEPAVQEPKKIARGVMAARRIAVRTSACCSAPACMQDASMPRALAT
jgi:hypothetical protein